MVDDDPERGGVPHWGTPICQCSVYKGLVDDVYFMTSSQTDRQTDTVMDTDVVIPTCYVSIRVTVPHDTRSRVLKLLDDQSIYIVYPHMGKDGTNPHFHIFVPSSDKRLCDTMRNRFKREYGRSGNEFIAVKFMSNGILNSITYGSKEGSEPVVKGDEAVRWVSVAPPWEDRPKNIGAYLDKPLKREVDPDHFRQITFRNIEKVTLRYRQQRGIKSDQLEVTLAAMHADNYRLDRSLTMHGIPAVVFDEFTAKCKGETKWSANRFSMMRVKENWHCL